MRNCKALTALMLTAGTSCGADSSHATNPCAAWVGTYVVRIDETNSFVGDGELRLIVRPDSLGWSIRGGSSPVLLAEANQFRCSQEQIAAHFIAEPQHEGQLVLSRQNEIFVLELKQFHPLPKGPVNYTGYVPNRPVVITRLREE